MADEQGVSVGGQVRAAVGPALMASFVAGGGFIVFAWTTTQAKTVRAASPWQDDPYDVVVSFTEFVVPAVLLLMALRMLLWRNDQPQPAFRVAQLARTAAASTGLVALTAATDWIAVAVQADRTAWTATITPALITALAVLTAVTAAGLTMQRKALRLMVSQRVHDGDWLDDIEPLAALLTGGRAIVRPSHYRSVATFIRRHDIAVLAATAVSAGAAVTASQAIGEEWTDPRLVVFAMVVATSGFFGMAMLGNHILVFAAPVPRPNRIHRAVRAAATAAALAVPATVGLRDAIWSLLGDVTEHTPLGLLLLATGGAVIVGSMTFTVTATCSHS
ncbi:hypothetical protein VMT65_05130 [Nocardia sp. CDC153]|uniref:hypothetical protein n=1 Tax=Nocardia sp. CDC153 TaxID=3112167 RepID=UPI002DBB4B4D|nr:hypothetical protein [Nocardia sp. CDC153]MEC3952412.1 hypothetical protein [Nocardia sp. CDC153]